MLTTLYLNELTVGARVHDQNLHPRVVVQVGEQFGRDEEIPKSQCQRRKSSLTRRVGRTAQYPLRMSSRRAGCALRALRADPYPD